MIDVSSATVPPLPPPTDAAASPKKLVTELGVRVGTATAARWCADLLAGADVREYAGMLAYLGRNCGSAAFDPSWRDYWHRTWGARGLLYVWVDDVAADVVRGLSDQHWRPAEMCLKVAARRDIGPAGDAAAALVGHELPRVRQHAVRCLGVVGDTEHLTSVEDALDDDNPDVRRAAARALTLMVNRLDLHYTPPDSG